MRQILICLAVIWSIQASAESAMQYRSAFLDNCRDEGEDWGVCACVFDRWVDGMENPSAPGAVTAARILATADEREPTQQEAAQAAPYMGQLGVVSDQCAQEVYARAREQESRTPDAEPRARGQEDGGSDGSAGLLGGLFGVVGDKLGVAKDVTQKAAKGTGSLLGKMNPFKKQAAADDGLALTERPVADYEPIFADYCMQSWESDSICGCRWQSLTATLGGVDTAQTRTVAYMASHEPGDLAIPDGAAVDRERAMQTLSQYMDTASSCGS